MVPDDIRNPASLAIFKPKIRQQAFKMSVQIVLRTYSKFRLRIIILARHQIIIEQYMLYSFIAFFCINFNISLRGNLSTGNQHHSSEHQT